MLLSSEAVHVRCKSLPMLVSLKEQGMKLINILRIIAKWSYQHARFFYNFLEYLLNDNINPIPHPNVQRVLRR